MIRLLVERLALGRWSGRLALVSMICVLVGFAGEAKAADSAGLAQISGVKASREGELFSAEVQMKGDLITAETQVHYFNEVVQVDFPGATVATPKGKVISKVDDRIVKSIFIYQPEGEAARARVILKPGFVARSLEGQVKVVRRGTNIAIELAGDAQKGPTQKGGANEKEITRTVAIQNADELSDDASALPTKLVADANVPQPAVELNPSGADPITGAAAADVESKPALPPKEVLNKLPESQIPVLATTKSEKKEAGGNWYRLMVTLGILTVVLGATSYGVKRWAANGRKNNQNTRIKILTQHHLGPKKSLAIVQVAGESILIGMTDQNISMLKTLSLIDDEIPEEVPSHFNNAMADFVDDEDDEAPKARKGRKKRQEPEDFAMRGLSEIRDVVSSRLRSFKNLDE